MKNKILSGEWSNDLIFGDSSEIFNFVWFNFLPFLVVALWYFLGLGMIGMVFNAFSCDLCEIIVLMVLKA